MKDMQTDHLEGLEGILSEQDPELVLRRRRAYEIAREHDISSFPRDISILSSFDEVFQCFGIMGQIRHYYRYGTYTSCEEARRKLWFALKNGHIYDKELDVDRMIKDPRELERRARIEQFYKERLMKQKLAGTSEDVWKERETLLSHPFRE